MTNFITENKGQIFRYGFIGLSLNIAMYVVYLMITEFYFSPFEAVFLLYPIGMLAGFYAHRRFTFKDNLNRTNFVAFIKYISAYILGFLLNLLLIYIFFEKLGYPHQLVQLSAIFTVALFIYVVMRLFVFPAVNNKASRVV